jgi:arsenite oxidase small subunit
MEEKGRFLVDEGKRRDFKRMALISIGLGVVGILPMLRSAIPAPVEVPKWPRVKVANAKGLNVGSSKIFTYPLEDSPNVLVKLGKRVDGGVGPDGDIVGYSQICQHLGCFVRFQSSAQQAGSTGNVFYCPCHAGIYDVSSGQILGGPPLYPLPQVLLQYDSTSGDIFAYGMGPPVIFGKGPPGSTEIWRDLVGGKLVAETGT